MADDFNPNWFDIKPVFDFKKNFGETTEDYMNLKQSILTILLSRGARQVMLDHVRKTYPSFHNAFTADNQVLITYRHGPSIKVGYICELPPEYRNRKIDHIFINEI
ncbi:hypothetical protein J4219_07920 [Candidatus Woesearchaeota archaeon]|nr:hypothetical protein [Candidatus Woesearchaeota archaeon]